MLKLLWYNINMSYFLAIKNSAKNHSASWLWLAILIYVILFTFLSLKKLDNYLYNLLDLAIFNQVFFNTLQGHWFDLTVNVNNYLADHFSPIIFLLLPFWLKTARTSSEGGVTDSLKLRVIWSSTDLIIS